MSDSFARCVSVSTLWAAAKREQGPKTQPGRVRGPGPKVTDALGGGPVSWAHWKQPPLDAQSDNTDTGEKRNGRPDRAGTRQYSLGDGEGSIPLRGTEDDGALPRIATNAATIRWWSCLRWMPIPPCRRSSRCARSSQRRSRPV